MTAVKIGGKEYILRPDLNALSEIAEATGGFETVPDISGVLAVTAILINEHFAFVGEKERVTPQQIGNVTDIRDLAALRKAVSAALKEGLGDEKNA